MADFTFNCPHCQQSLETTAEMAGQSIDCPACQNPIEIPFQSRISPVMTKPPISRNVPSSKLPKKMYVQKKTTFNPVLSAQPKRTGAPGLVFAVIVLTVICTGLVFYLIKFKNAGTGTGTLFAPTKQNATENTVEQKSSDLTVDGEVFIVTKGGESIKLGLVEVSLIPMEALTTHLQNRRTQITNELSRIRLETKEVEADVIRLHEKLMSDIRNFNKEKESKAANDKYTLLLDRQLLLMSGSLYFESLPSPLRSTKANSDGKFHLLVPASGNYAIAASASRQIMNKTEDYYWLLKIDPKAGAVQTIMLSNDNVASSKSIESLIQEK